MFGSQVSTALAAEAVDITRRRKAEETKGRGARVSPETRRGRRVRIVRVACVVRSGYLRRCRRVRCGRTRREVVSAARCLLQGVACGDWAQCQTLLRSPGFLVELAAFDAQDIPDQGARRPAGHRLKKSAVHSLRSEPRLKAALSLSRTARCPRRWLARVHGLAARLATVHFVGAVLRWHQLASGPITRNRSWQEIRSQ